MVNNIVLFDIVKDNTKLRLSFNFKFIQYLNFKNYKVSQHYDNTTDSKLHNVYCVGNIF